MGEKHNERNNDILSLYGLFTMKDYDEICKRYLAFSGSNPSIKYQAPPSGSLSE